jgi:hypothetical protein
MKEWTEKYGAEHFIAIGLSKYEGYQWDDEQKTGSIKRDISEPNQRKSLKQFAAHHGMEHPLAITTRQTMLDLGVHSIPQLMLFDREGTLQRIAFGASDESFAQIEQEIASRVKDTDPR